jgi:3-oxoacyl-(acyl-carrier-protein) synthase
MTRRVVVTGLGVMAPNGNGRGEFDLALRKGRSGLRRHAAMEEAGFGCKVAGVPEGVDERAQKAFDEELLLAMNSSHRLAALAALEAWEDGGLARPDPDAPDPDWESGAIIGTGIGGMDTTAARVVPLVNAGKARRLGSTSVEQVMASGVSARVGGILGLGNQVTTNSSACSTGAEAVVDGALRIRQGLAERMLCGGVEGESHYIWAGFDAMRVLCRGFNDEPARASRPMSASAGGFIPAAGAGVLLLESLESAERRGAPIHAEIAGVAVNSGGQRGGGSMTAVEAWAQALEREPGRLPPITSTKSMIGHALGAAGAIECVAGVLMVEGGFVHPSINCEDLHPDIEPHADSVPHELLQPEDLRVLAKAGFGFGDVNAAVVFRRWDA